MPRTKKLAEAPLTNYDKLRAQNLVKNNQLFQSLGINALVAIIKSTKNKDSAIPREDSGSEYDPQENEGTEQDEIDDTLVEEKDALDDTPSISTATTDKVSKKTTKKTSRMPPGGRGPPKRVLASLEPNQPARVTRQRIKELTLTQTDVGSLGRSPGLEELPTRSPQPADEICATPSLVTSDALTAADFPAQSEEQRHMGDEGNRQHHKGRGLERISRGLSTKITINIAEGKRRLGAPMQAAKEGGIILRQHLPTFHIGRSIRRMSIIF